jgi:O-phosphoseryl-tRNA(Cys) synthetase
MKTYVTFGQDHVHRVNGKTFDHNCVAVIESPSSEEGRAKAFELFGPKFCFEYFDTEWDEKSMKYYPRGYMEVE